LILAATQTAVIGLFIVISKMFVKWVTLNKTLLSSRLSVSLIFDLSKKALADIPALSYSFSDIKQYLTGEFNTIYLYLDLVFIAVGLVCAWLFMTRPSPKLAYTLTLVFMMGMGLLICLAMVLGSLL